MPHGKKRGTVEYEQEIEDAVKRFSKYPERLKFAGDSEEWREFLSSVGIPEEKGIDFFESVRERTVQKYIEPFEGNRRKAISDLIKEYENRQVYIDTNKKGSVYREVYTEKKVVYRDIKTGRFTKRR